MRQWRKQGLITCLGFFLITVSPVALTEKIAYLALGDKGYWQVWVMTVGEDNARQLTFSEYDKNRMSVYPDGKHLLVNGNLGELVKLALDSGSEQTVKLPLSGFTDAQLSPDGRYIAFSLSSTGNPADNNIWLFEVATGQLQKLTNLENLQHEPRWSRDGRQLYFHSKTDQENHDLWVIDLEKGGHQQLTHNYLYHLDTAAGRDGVLAYSGNHTGNYEIWLLYPDKKRKQLTFDAAFDGHPAWSADGSSLYFESDRNGRPGIWQLDIQAGKLIQLTSSKKAARYPVVLSAGRNGSAE